MSTSETYLETEECPRQLMARQIRRRGLPAAARWSAADSYATLYIDAQGRVLADDYAQERDVLFLEDLSVLSLAHLWSHAVRDEEAEELRQEIERQQRYWESSGF